MGRGPADRTGSASNALDRANENSWRHMEHKSMNLKRWWCAATTHKWRRERRAGTDQLICRRCGFVTNLKDESRQARHWDSSGFNA